MIGKIYKIIHTESDVCYVASTIKRISQCWQEHKGNYKRYLQGSLTGSAIYPYFKKYGMENFKIILIKEYEIVDNKHLLALEQLWINKLKCVNKRAAFRIDRFYFAAYREMNKGKLKQHYLDNRDQYMARMRAYYESHKDKIKQYTKEHYLANIVKRKEQSKQYREANKVRLDQKMKKYRDRLKILKEGFLELASIDCF